MPLTKPQRVNTERFMSGAAEEYLGRPLWEFHPYYRSAVLNERRRRRILQSDPEPSGDPEYS
jgi:hypothetical protein